MQVLKFGGSSVATAESIMQVRAVIEQEKKENKEEPECDLFIALPFRLHSRRNYRGMTMISSMMRG